MMFPVNSQMQNHFKSASDDRSNADYAYHNKATPKTLKHAMAVDGLTQRHVKSHLQKFRMEKVTMHEPHKTYKANPNAGAISCASTSSQEPSHENGSNIKKTSRSRKDSPGELYPQLQAARRLQDSQEARQKVREIPRASKRERLTNHNPYDTGMGSNHQNNVGGRMFVQDLSGFENLATGSVTTPLYSAQQNPYFNPYNSLEQLQTCLGLEQETSTVSAGHQQQPEHVDVAANAGDFMTSTGYSIPVAIVNMQVGLQEQKPPAGFQNQNEVNNFQNGNGAYQAAQINGGDFGNFEPGNGYNCLENQNGDYSVQVPEQSATNYNAASSSSCAVNSVPMWMESYLETAFLDDDYNEALVATIRQNEVVTTEEEEDDHDDPVEAFMNMNLDI
ncbi:hypothetical protein ACOSQ3_003002 [Xanthoceras sorbifolium]